MKILVLCYEYPPLGGGGGRVAKTVAEALVRRGHEVRVQTAALGWRSHQETIDGVEVFRTASGRRRPERCSVLEMLSYCVTSIRPTLAHIDRWQPDVIHTHFVVPTGALAWLVHRLTGTPYVLTAHLGDVPGGAPGQTDALFRFIAPFARIFWHAAAGLTAVSAWVCTLATRGYGRAPKIIHNGIRLDDTAARTDAPGDTVELVFIGRLNPQKCPLFLLEVLALVPAKNWRLTIVGDGELMPALREKLAASGLGDRVQLTGWLAGPEVEQVLHRSHIFLLPSTFEGLPVAAAEALKHSLALLVSDIPGLHDVVDEGVNGYRLPIGDTAAWSARISALLADPAALAALAALQRASWAKAQDFALPHIAEEYEAVLEGARA